MSRWMKVAAVALAAVVAVVPMFAQLGYAQAASSTPVIFPLGEELQDTDLVGVEGEHWEIYLMQGLGVFYFETIGQIYLVPDPVTSFIVWLWLLTLNEFHQRLHWGF